jgi:protein SCO1/2
MLLALVVRASPVALAGCGTLTSATVFGSHSPAVAPRGTFTDDHGQRVALDSFRGAPVVVSTFFTSCTVRCPMTVEKLRELDAAFRRTGAPVSFVLVTLDPRTDTPERLGRYKRDHALPDTWHLLSGTAPETHAVARYLGVNAAFDDGHIDHEVRVAIFDAKGALTQGYAGWTWDANAAARAVVAR